MNFPWSKSHQRRDLLAQPMPSEWQHYMTANVPYYSQLPSAEQQKLADTTRILIAEKNWEGVGGLTLTDEIQVTIAGLASLLVLGFDHDYYANVETILVYPQGFLVTEQRMETQGVYAEAVRPLVGQAALHGPVIVSWSDVRHEGWPIPPGRNVVLHEFAHKLDMRDGAADGAPYLKDAAQVAEWERVMSAAYANLVRQTQAGDPTLLDAYGTTNAAEFFAVATECFFELPRPMQHEMPDLYAVLRGYYRQDPVMLAI